MEEKKNHYEEVAEKVTNKIFPYLVKDLENFYGESFKGLVILDLGCGPGHITKELLKQDFEKVLGIDISEDMLERSRQRNGNTQNLELICASAENIPLDNESVDLIISRGSVFFWKDINKAFKEIFRILKPKSMVLIGGGYGISTPDDVVEEIQLYYSVEAEKRIKKTSRPKIEPNKLLELALSIGGSAEIVSKEKRGFWLIWWK